MDTILSIWRQLSDWSDTVVAPYEHRLLHAADKHAGLAAWVGAIGVIVAILATWRLARAEYLRLRRHDIARRNAEIDRVTNIVEDFEELVQRQISTDAAAASVSYTLIMADPKLDAMHDLQNFVPVTAWPSLETHAYFKRYYRVSFTLLQVTCAADRETALPTWIQKHDDALPPLRRALKLVRQ